MGSGNPNVSTSLQIIYIYIERERERETTQNVVMAGAGNFFLHYRVQNGSGAHPASYPMVTRGSFPGDKAAGA
jgi:hypothetical protein